MRHIDPATRRRIFSRLLLPASLPLTLVLVLNAAACKTTDDAPAAAVSPTVVTAGTPSGGDDESDAPAPTVKVVSGFDWEGESACLELAEARTCLGKPDALSESCVKAGGSASRCEDCSVLCSVALPATAARP